MGMSESHDSEAVDAAHAGHDTTERMTLGVLAFPIHIGRHVDP